ncbi:DNA replication and repair protein RecN [Tahibacter aquaticus]|uniref:DNA repair protein RecN n=1 Tax=Tahibacter aquaticus TaxID=520092 RepID=A0A4R6YNL1_9GAMM|nr:DNA repair protein RecN [Tahibacter aquaticus]TDR39143.1 DNA replication and repair protein RecN [Tahibacter aquaticus]
MLRSLYVKDFAIVGEADINFQAGLSVVTGETGAGKSLLVDALLLLSGARSDSSVIRHGCDRAELTADFDLADAIAARDWLAAEELDDDGACQLRRVIRAEGSSRAWINGRPVTLAQLSALSEHLIEIHGQHEHQALLDRNHQLQLLDAFGEHADALAAVRLPARRWREIGQRMAGLSSHADHGEQLALLERQLLDLDRYALSEAQLAELNEMHKRLANAGQLVAGSNSVAELIDGDSEFALRRSLARARHELAKLAEIDPGLNATAELLESLEIQLGEAADTLSRYQDGLELDPERLQELDAQLSKLHELSRRHRLPVHELKNRAEELRGEVDTLRNAGSLLQELERERTALAQDYRKAAQTLTTLRQQTAQRLGHEVSQLMGELGMSGGRFEVDLEASSKDEPDALGAERCEFLVSANQGQSPRPLRKVASGGELSRISLAIEVAALGLDEVGTMVFDEVDSGIGGAVAEVVGQKLRRLGSTRQALCVTHLAQVAAQGHQHFRVSKASRDGETFTRIEALDDKSRRDEIARMLGGIEITKETLAHARQMLERAAKG